MIKALLCVGLSIANALLWLAIERWLNRRRLTWREWMPACAYGATNVAVIDWMFQ